jgi:hypothetical protein
LPGRLVSCPGSSKSEMRCAKITVDCASLVQPTGATIDQIARLQLAARRCDCDLELKNTNPFLRELIAFVGLSGVLSVESRRQAEEREHPCGVEEERELDDPPC